MQNFEPGRRERQRVATWTRIHESAVTLVLEQGLPEVTTAAIAERAGVSARTFFNYFPTKEDAVLGTREPTLPPELFEEFLGGEADPLTRTVRLLAGVLRTSTDAGEAFRRRRELVRTFPELRRRTLQHVQAAERLVESALAEQPEAVAAEGEWAGPHDAGNAQPALLMLAGTITRFVFTRDPEGFNADHRGAVDAAVEVFRGVFEASR